MAKKKRKFRLNTDQKIGIFVVLPGLILISIFLGNLFVNVYNNPWYLTGPESEVRFHLEPEYEVLNVTDYGAHVTLELIAEGDREKQVWHNAVGALDWPYPEAESYEIVIHEPTQKCYYSTAGTNYNSWRDFILYLSWDEDIYVDEDGELDGLNFRREVQFANEIDNQEIVDRYAKYGWDDWDPTESVGWNALWEGFVEDYPAVDNLLVYTVAKYQVMGSERCE